jgi:hypothetical protein
MPKKCKMYIKQGSTPKSWSISLSCFEFDNAGTAAEP